MNIQDTNRVLSVGAIGEPGLFPRLEKLKEAKYIFRMRFGLDRLPSESGMILIRGARQYGKSTWLQDQIKNTIEEYGPGSAYYLNGDELRNDHALVAGIRELLPIYESRSKVQRLFIDEVTAIDNWQKALKMLADEGELRHVLIVTTGSKAADLRRGSERLPGRKGKLGRTSYLFTPVSYAEFKRVCGSRLKGRTLSAYILSGGSPVACSELASHGRIPEYVIEMTRDWVYGEFAATGRARASLLGVMQCLHRFACSPVGQSKLAREAGLANNTIAAGYIELLADLMCVAQSYAWDASRRRPNRRRPCKFHIMNLLAAVAWHPLQPRSIADFAGLSPEEQSSMTEWLVAQEIWRRRAIRGDELPELMTFWQSKTHEIDFVLEHDEFLEVKHGKRSPVEFAWFAKLFPHAHLTVINKTRFETRHVRGITLEEFLCEDRMIRTEEG